MSEHKFLVGLHNSSEGFICATFFHLSPAFKYAAEQQARTDDEWKNAGDDENVNVFTVVDNNVSFLRGKL